MQNITATCPRVLKISRFPCINIMQNHSPSGWGPFDLEGINWTSYSFESEVVLFWLPQKTQFSMKLDSLKFCRASCRAHSCLVLLTCLTCLRKLRTIHRQKTPGDYNSNEMSSKVNKSLLGILEMPHMCKVCLCHTTSFYVLREPKHSFLIELSLLCLNEILAGNIHKTCRWDIK